MSAQSAKILIESLRGSATGQPADRCSGRQNPPRSLEGRGHHRIRLGTSGLSVPSVDQHGTASGTMPSVHVAPPVSHHETPLQIKPVLGCRSQQQTGARLAAPAAVCVIVRANTQIIYLDLPSEPSMNRVNDLLRLTPSSKVWLIRNHTKEKSGGPQLLTS
jgi:hypothetical protein